jgi:hypothetical protein
MTVFARDSNLELIFHWACSAAVRLAAVRLIVPRFVDTPSSPRKGVHIGYRISTHLLATTYLFSAC